MAASAESQSEFRAAIARFMIVGFTALLGVIISTGVLMTMAERQTRRVTHTFQVQHEISVIRLTVTELVGVKLRNRLHATAHGAAEAATLQDSLEQSINRLASLTGDNPRQQARMPLLMASASQVEHQAGLDVPVEARTGILSDDPGELVAVLCTAMQAEESQLMASRNARQAEIGKAFFVILGLTGVLLLLVAALTYATLRSYTREIVASRHALHDANTGLEAAVQERTAELIRANSEIQRFAYIVSHDLRSPLVNIMGFASELENATLTLQSEVRQAQADHPDAQIAISRDVIEEDLPEAIHFIRTSTQKMDRLINAILKLSRVGRRLLSPEWLHVEKVAQGVAETLQILINQTGATVEIAHPMPEIFCDRVALEQMLANLIENAIKYRQKERPLHIGISAQRHGDRVAIAVADNGRGIDPRDTERVFDLFRRSGAQDQPGEGIGLAHVRALAYRLNGTVRLKSSPGIGSTFTITLPMHFNEDQGLQA